MVDFGWKFPNIRFHGKRGWSDTNFAYTVILADRENPLFGARILMISLLIEKTSVYHTVNGDLSECQRAA